MHNHRAAPSDAQQKSMDHQLTDRKGVKVKTRKLVQKKKHRSPWEQKKGKEKTAGTEKRFQFHVADSKPTVKVKLT